MKSAFIMLLFLLIFSFSVFSQEIDPQFAIDLLTGKIQQSDALPCSGPPGSGCENIVPQLSTMQRPELEQPELQRTPANPAEYARQQIPHYRQAFPNWNYVIWRRQQREFERQQIAREAAFLYKKDLSYWEKKRQQEKRKHHEQIDNKGEQGLPGERAGDPAGQSVSSPSLPPYDQAQENRGVAWHGGARHESPQSHITSPVPPDTEISPIIPRYIWETVGLLGAWLVAAFFFVNAIKSLLTV